MAQSSQRSSASLRPSACAADSRSLPLFPKEAEFTRVFETLACQPETLGAELCARFALEFGAEDWRQLITSHAKAWLQLATGSSTPRDDLYRGKLHEISAPTLFIHGALDPRTEPGELNAASQQLPHAEMQILDGAAHSPHSESASADLVTQIAREFLMREARTVNAGNSTQEVQVQTLVWLFLSSAT